MNIYRNDVKKEIESICDFLSEINNIGIKEQAELISRGYDPLIFGANPTFSIKSKQVQFFGFMDSLYLVIGRGQDENFNNRGFVKRIVDNE